MDQTFVVGVAAAVSATIIFCGSVWLLLAMILGGRLAYFVSASVTLAFVLIMGVVWGFTNPVSPLGPVGETPSWSGIEVGPDATRFGYPDGDWRVPEEGNEEDSLLKSGVEGDAADYLEQAIEEEQQGIEFEEVDEASVNSDETRLIEQEGETFGAVVLDPIEGVEAEPVTVIMEYDPGNPLSTGRWVTAGTFGLLVLHLFGIAHSEKKAKQLPGAEVT